MKSKIYFRITISAILLLIFGKFFAQHPSPPWAWAKAFYGTNVLNGTNLDPDIAVDPSSGAVYTTGSYLGTVDFDPGPGIFHLDSKGLYADMFISKLDANGHFVWAKHISPTPDTGSSRGYSIAVDPSGSGDVYTTGCFHGYVDFDPGLETFILNYSGYAYHNSDIFVSKLDSSGNFKWARRIGGTGDAYGRSIAVDPLGSGDVYVLGSFEGTIDFDPGEDSYPLTSNGKYDFFITKLDRSGNLVWAKSIGGARNDVGFDMDIDPHSGDIYITGDFTGQVNFNPDDSLHIFTSGSAFDIFILKLDPEGNFVWVKVMFGPGSKGGAGYGIALDPGSGDVYTTGYFEGKVDFNPDDKGIYNLYSAGENDVFISKLDSSGHFVWAKAMGGIEDDKGNAIVFDPVEEGGVYIMGNFAQTADLDPGPNTFHLTALNSNDIFISKLNREGEFEWAKPVYTFEADHGSSLAIDGSFLYMTGLFPDLTISFDEIELTNTSDSTFFWDVYIAKLNTTLTTAVEEIERHSINIYPNPASNELTVEFEKDYLNVGIHMFNILGELVFSSPEKNGFYKTTIDISTLALGIYIMEVQMDGERVLKKIVKQ